MPLFGLTGADLGLHVIDLHAGQAAEAARVGEGTARVLRVHVDLDHVVLGDHEDAPTRGVYMLLELLLVAFEAVDEELRAVSPGLFLGVDSIQVWRVVFVRLGDLDLLPTNAGVDAVENHGNTQPPGIDDAGLAQDSEQIGGAAHRIVGRLPRHPDYGRQVSVRSFDGLAGSQGRILDYGEHRALDRFANRGVGSLPCAFEPGCEGPGVQGSPVGQYLACAPDHLREYDPGVSPRAHQRGPGTGPTRLLEASVGLARGFVQRGFQGEQHVRARVPVRHGIDVEIVDPGDLGLDGRVGCSNHGGHLYRHRKESLIAPLMGFPADHYPL